MNALSEKLQSVFKNIRGYGKLTESNIADSLREVRMALLAADVNYRLAKEFCERVKEKVLGEEVQQSIRPGELFVKIVHDELIALFDRPDAALPEGRPLRIVLCGLNGAGKTTSAAKLAVHLKGLREKPFLVAADLTRPAAAEQLATLARRNELPVLVPGEGDSLESYLAGVEEKARAADASVVIYDLAGRLEADEELLDELKRAVGIIRPQESLLVADAAMGQGAVEVAKAFHEHAGVTGIILSKFDGDARGGAAFSLQEVTGCPIKFLGTGEKTADFEPFDPDRLVRRLLGMGDLYGLAQKVQGTIDLEDAARLEERLRKQEFDLQDFLDQMRQLKKLGPLQNLLGMLPQFNSMPNSALDERGLNRTEAIISSMTKQERRRPELINARRRQRVATGSGTSATEVNQLLQRFRTMKKLMGKMGRGGKQETMLKRLLGGR